MDIKGALNQALPISLRQRERGLERVTKSDKSTDRDGNGQTTYDDNSKRQQQEPMTDEQFEKALEHLRGLSVVREQNLTVEMVFQGQRKVVLIKESDGKVLRRIFEPELATLQVVGGTEKGQLLSKTA